MKHLLKVALFLAIAALAFGQAPSIPICNGFDATTGAPINTASPTKPCTDNFGSGNWANSPLPAGIITGYTLIAGGATTLPRRSSSLT